MLLMLKINKINNITVFLFFFVFFVLGIFIFDDYGISCDEAAQREIGIMNYQYITKTNNKLIDNVDRYHGPFFEMLLFGIETIWNRLDSNNGYMDIRDVYLMRHFVTFFTFYVSVFFFFLLCKHHFGDWKPALLGCLLLALSPRIFSQAFYNSKDLPFLSLFIISIYTLIKFLDKKTLARAFLHALACGLLIDIRMMGIVVPCFTFLFIMIDFLCGSGSVKMKIKKVIPGMICYVLLLIVFVILLWPILWEGPVYHFIEAFKDLSRHLWYLDVLYLGEYVSAADVPWHYIPVWFFMTTPIVYILFFIVGLIYTVYILVLKSRIFLKDKQIQNNLIFLLWFFLPLIAVIALHSVLYDSWRHMFFIYPAFLLITLIGIQNGYRWIQFKSKWHLHQVAMIFFFIILFGGLSEILYFMVKYHPYQDVYFNRIAGKDMESIKQNFDLDYWSLSYTKALEYILQNDQDEIITFNFDNYCGETTFFSMLPRELRTRLKYVDNLEEAKYFLGNYRWHREEYPFREEFYSIKVGGANIMVVYKLKG